MAELSEVQEYPNSQGFDLRSILKTFYRSWKLIAICTVIAVLITIDSLRHAVYIYSAQMQVTPVQATGDDGGANRLGALSGLASIAGMSLPSGQNGTQFRLYIESLYSRDLAEELSKNQNLMRTLFPGEWDTSIGAWRQPPADSFAKFKTSLRPYLGLRPLTWKAPDGARLQDFLKLSLIVIQDPRKPYLATIAFQHPDSNFAINFLTLLNQTADNQLRQRALLRARQYIGYLANQLSTVTNVEHRMAITQALSEQERFAMAANSAAPFAADVFDKPSASPQPVEPSPRKLLAMAVLLGAAAGGALALAIQHLGGSLRTRFRFRRRETGYAKI